MAPGREAGGLYFHPEPACGRQAKGRLIPARQDSFQVRSRGIILEMTPHPAYGSELSTGGHS
jgi:hypothetical protein